MDVYLVEGERVKLSNTDYRLSSFDDVGNSSPIGTLWIVGLDNFIPVGAVRILTGEIILETSKDKMFINIQTREELFALFWIEFFNMATDRLFTSVKVLLSMYFKNRKVYGNFKKKSSKFGGISGSGVTTNDTI